MSKELQLTLGERLAALTILNSGEMNRSTLAVALEDIKKLAVTPEEWTAANLQKTPNANGTETWKWDEKEPKAVTLDHLTIEFIQSKIKEKSDSNKMTLADQPLLTLEAKIK